MGGNPIAPYGDKSKNYFLTMISNFEANATLMNTILEMQHLYDITYSVGLKNNNPEYSLKYKK